jgi:hypothetical protein
MPRRGEQVSTLGPPDLLRPVKRSRLDAMRGTQDTAGLTSNQRLARDIAGQLVKEGLIDGSRRAALELGLAEGNLGADAWRAFIVSGDRERRHS